MRTFIHRASPQALYSNRTARTLQNNLTARRRSSQIAVITLVVLVFFLCSTVLFSWNLFSLDQTSSVSVQQQQGNLVRRIAFGSSSAHDYGSQPVWVQGVIPSNPDVWIWLGGMAYLDEPRVNCEALPNHAQCNCSANWLQQPPHFCMAGNVEHATSRMQAQLANPDYAQFLAFMCPEHRKRGLFPPSGSDPSVCPRSILGTYDDHDYSWKRGNKRLPQKDILKQVFLDAIGEAPDSPRRSRDRGIHWKYSFNEDTKGDTIDVILLDTRYYRDPLPCYTRRHLCEEITGTNKSHEQYAWCIDFLKGGESGNGSCCKKDEVFLQEWCSQENNMKLPVWKGLCDPSAVSEALIKIGSSFSGQDFCEVLGIDQREWLEDVLLQSDAPVKLLVSSSSLLEDTTKELLPNGQGCADDWGCYKPAQAELLEVVSKASGCVIVLTGNSGYSDIRVSRPSGFSRPLHQIMASGLTMNTLKNVTCDGVCDGPSFGMVEIENSVVKLQIRDGLSSQALRELSFSLSDCSGGSN